MKATIPTERTMDRSLEMCLRDLCRAIHRKSSLCQPPPLPSQAASAWLPSHAHPDVVWLLRTSSLSSHFHVPNIKEHFDLEAAFAKKAAPALGGCAGAVGCRHGEGHDDEPNRVSRWAAVRPSFGQASSLCHATIFLMVHERGIPMGVPDSQSKCTALASTISFLLHRLVSAERDASQIAKRLSVFH